MCKDLQPRKAKGGRVQGAGGPVEYGHRRAFLVHRIFPLNPLKSPFLIIKLNAFPFPEYL